MFSINKFALDDNYSTQVTVQNLTDLRLTGTQNSDIDGELNNLSDFNFKLKTNFAIPSEVWQVSNDSFDETILTFDDTGVTFDAG
jgi:mannosyltransferase OCH1-like enzyme